MKKIILFVLAVISMISLGSFNIFAEEYVTLDITKNIKSLDEFNMLRAGFYDEEDRQDFFSHVDYFLGAYVESGEIISKIKGKFNNETHYVEETFYFESYELSRIVYKFDNDIFYDIRRDIDYDTYLVNTDYGYDISYKLGNYYESFIKESTETDYSKALGDISDNLKKENTYFFFALYGIDAKYNQEYYDYDCHIPTRVSNRISMEEINSVIGVYDSCITDTSYKIINNTYNPESLTCGEYSFSILAWDLSLNASIQNVLVDVLDDIKPEIEGPERIETTYSEFLSKEDVYNYFQVSDLTETSYDIESDYFLNQNVTGDYQALLTVTDSYGNVSEKSFIISVKDLIAPKLLYALYIRVSANNPLTEDEIKSHIRAIDEYEGDISSKVELDDLNGYLNNPTKPGNYNFTVTCSDESGNKKSGPLTLYAVDEESPSITIEKYIILTEKGRPISKEEVQALFESLGYDVSLSNLVSEAFQVEELDGEYDLDLELEGNMYHNSISTEDIEVKEEISYEVPTVTKKKKSLSLSMILIISISSTLILVCFVMGVVLYKKKH